MKIKPKILIVDCSGHNLDELYKSLKRADLDHVALPNPESAMKIYNDARYSLVLLCWCHSCVRFCRWIRSIDQNTPIILICDGESDFDIVEALKLGCDDFVTAPINAKELAARLQMVLSRIKRAERAALNNAPDLVIEADNLMIDTLNRRVTVDGRPIDLTVTEYNILSMLASNRGRAYTRRELLHLLWDYDAEVYEHTINSHINRLRAKIETNPRAPKHILTVWGVGYRFSAV